MLCPLDRVQIAQCLAFSRPPQGSGFAGLGSTGVKARWSASGHCLNLVQGFQPCRMTKVRR